MESVRALTFCRVCEPACGLVATVRDGRLAKLEPDHEHPVTQGFACPKGLAGVEINHDPDRVDHPYRRRPDGALEQRTWDDAIASIASTVRAIVDRYGPSAIATYAGNPSGFNSLLGTALPSALRQLGARRYFNAGTQDCVNKYAGSNATCAAVRSLRSSRTARMATSANRPKFSARLIDNRSSRRWRACRSATVARTFS